jgi:hypothetical protein
LKFTLAIYGPWERVINDKKLLDAFVSYIRISREIADICEIIYVQTESNFMPRSDLFDRVYLTSRENIFSELQRRPGTINFDYNLGFLVKNIKTAHENVKSDHIICHRCDVVPKDLSELINIYKRVKHKKRFLIDYAPDHTCLIPYYLSDFFYIGPVLELDLTQIKTMATVEPSQRVWNFRPTRSLTVGRIKKNYCYSEYAIWSCLYLRKKIKPMSQNNLFDLILFKYFSKTVEFISRSKYFLNLGKIVDVNSKEINFKNIGYFSLRHIALSLFLFVLRSLEIVMKKFLK